MFFYYYMYGCVGCLVNRGRDVLCFFLLCFLGIGYKIFWVVENLVEGLKLLVGFLELFFKKNFFLK